MGSGVRPTAAGDVAISGRLGDLATQKQTRKTDKKKGSLEGSL
jgi:hypothetical protein